MSSIQPHLRTKKRDAFDRKNVKFKEMLVEKCVKSSKQNRGALVAAKRQGRLRDTAFRIMTQMEDEQFKNEAEAWFDSLTDQELVEFMIETELQLQQQQPEDDHTMFDCTEMMMIPPPSPDFPCPVCKVNELSIRHDTAGHQTLLGCPCCRYTVTLNQLVAPETVRRQFSNVIQSHACNCRHPLVFQHHTAADSRTSLHGTCAHCGFQTLIL